MDVRLFERGRLFEKIIESIGDNRKCFLVQSSSDDIFNPLQLQRLVKNCMRQDYTVNYLSLLELTFTQLGYLYRFAGDGGDTFLGIDIFYRDQDLNLNLNDVLRKIVKS